MDENNNDNKEIKKYITDNYDNNIIGKNSHQKGNDDNTFVSQRELALYYVHIGREKRNNMYLNQEHNCELNNGNNYDKNIWNVDEDKEKRNRKRIENNNKQQENILL